MSRTSGRSARPCWQSWPAVVSLVAISLIRLEDIGGKFEKTRWVGRGIANGHGEVARPGVGVEVGVGSDDEDGARAAGRIERLKRAAAGCSTAAVRRTG
jgi:hypothetical protein